MSPEIFAAQLDAGAWGITVATGNQLLAAYSFGVRRILVANEIVDPTVLRWIAACDDAEILFYVDSLEGVASRGGRAGAVSVLLEVGQRPDRGAVPRGGARGRAARSTAGVDLSGRQRLRGRLRRRRRGARVPGRGARRRRRCSRAVHRRDEVLLRRAGRRTSTRSPTSCAPSPGGRTILRSGSYVTHDHGTYVSADTVHADRRQPAPGAAGLGAGARPRPTASRSSGPASATSPTTPGCRSRSTSRHPLDGHAHQRPARLPGGTARADPLAPGDLLELGISHPCTAFDKWRVIPILDADQRVVDVATTWF